MVLTRDWSEKIFLKFQNITQIHEYEEQYFEGNELDSDPLALDSLLRTVSMFHEEKLSC